MKWPENKDFAFTIIDDTDNAVLEDVKPVYEFLLSQKILTTKTVWVYPPRDRFKGDSLQDEKYRRLIVDLKEKGVEIAFHGVGSGHFTREEILKGLEEFKNILGYYPKIQINHAQNDHNIYWGKSGYGWLLRTYATLRGSREVFHGEVPGSDCFWGDFVKENIPFLRFRTFRGINTLAEDPAMPYRNRKKTLANYIFSASDGNDVSTFNRLLSEKNIEKLKREKGLCIVYTHFANGFAKENTLNDEFKERIQNLSKQNGWFVPASEILGYLVEQKKDKTQYVSGWYLFRQEFKILMKGIFGRL